MPDKNAKVNIRGVRFDNITMKEAIDKALTLIDSNKTSYIVTPNPEIVKECLSDREAMEAVNEADMAVPDGIGILYAARILKTPLKERVAGFDLATNLLDKLAEKGLGLYLFGAAPGVAEEAGEKIQSKYPGIVICGTHNGYFKQEETDAIIEDINKSGAKVVFVCLGAPKQEKWMAGNKSRIDSKLMMGLGGSLDIFAGRAKRAPKAFIDMHVEWLYRLLTQPSRFFRIAKIPLFLFSTLIYSLHRGKGDGESV